MSRCASSRWNRSKNPFRVSPSRSKTLRSRSSFRRPSVRAPDYAGPLVGWRVWRVAETRAGLRLLSAVYDDVWLPRREAVASCRHGHDAPDAACVCGIHALADRATAIRYLVGRNDPGVVGRVLGLVSLWGTVVECERGWRAERAYPLRLWAPPELLAGLAPYGVEQARVA